MRDIDLVIEELQAEGWPPRDLEMLLRGLRRAYGAESREYELISEAIADVNLPYNRPYMRSY